MIAQCPSCRRRIRIALPQVVDRNLVRCSECWSVFLVAADELRTVAKERAAAAGPERTDGDLSRKFAAWEQRSLSTKRPPLDDLPAPPAFDWTGFDEAEDSDEDVGEGTILSSVREKAPEGPGEVLFTLAVVEGPQAGLSVPVQKTPYVLGREGVDFVLNDPEASRRHACIQVMGSGEERRYELEDAGSTNGTIVGGTRVDRCQLHGSDEIRIGSTRIIFFPGRPALLSPRPALDGAALGKLYEDEGEETGDLTRTDGTGNALLPGRLPSRLKATIEVVQGPDAGLRLEVPKGALVIGREHADLRLRDPNVSRKHALLEILASDQIYLKDLASKNGTIVNGILVKVARLRSGDSIELGDTRLLFQAEVFV